MQTLKKTKYHPTIILRNESHIFDIGDGIPSLRGYDMGYGMTLFHLIRNELNEDKFRRCLEMHTKGGGSGLLSQREVKEFCRNLYQLRPSLSKTEVMRIAKTFGTLQGKEAFICAAKSTDGGTWIAIYDGCPLISSLVTSASDQYGIKDYLIKLRQVSNLGTWNRDLYASRIFALYYGVSKIEEVVWRTYVTPYNHISNRWVAIKTAMPAPSQEFAVYANQRILLLKNKTSSYIPVPECTAMHQINRRQEPLSRPAFAGVDVSRKLQPFFLFAK